MSKQYDIWVDGGLSTGIALVSYSDTQPLKVEQVWQVGGGVDGFLEWRRETDLHEHIRLITFYSEKFTPRQALTLDAAEPLLVEGAMVALGLIPSYRQDKSRYQHPAAQYFTGGTSLADKKKRSNAWLKAHGFYFTGKDVGQKDADDARSAVRHAINHARKRKHLPTLNAYFKED